MARTGVLGRPALKRRDITLGVGVHQTIGFRWWRSQDRGVTREAVDLTDYTGTIEIHGLDGTHWLTIAPILDDTGMAQLITYPATFAGPEWTARRNGTYALTLTSPTNTVTRLAHGYLYLAR